MYWLGFIGIPMMVFIASKISGKDSGYQKDTSHIWVYQRSGAKMKDATIRDVWEHNHPGKTWAQHQDNQFVGCAIFLAIGLIVFLFWLSARIFLLPTDNPGQRLFWQIGAPLLGGLSGGAFYGMQSFLSSYKSGFFKLLHIIALVVTALSVIGALVLSFLKIDLPISHHWIWTAAGSPLLFLILDQIFGSAKKIKASKGGDKLSAWVYAVMEFSYSWDQNKVKENMLFAIYQLQQGKFDYDIKKGDFFKKTESLMLDLVQGRSMSISRDEIYAARDEVIKALQAFYFYSVEKFPQFKMHPRIAKAIKK
jgi:hypothetical protein